MSTAVRPRPTPPVVSGASRNPAFRADDVIDVDAFDDDVVFVGSNPAPSSQEVLVISDNEDDVPQAGPSNRRQLFSPPPPPQYRAIPPVPRLPQHLQTYASFPRHQGHRRPQYPRFPADVIRPMDEPMTWEQHLRDPPRAHEDQTPPHATRPAAAPRSQFTPTMGLGGAILAMNDGPARGRWPRLQDSDDGQWGIRNANDPPRRVHHWVDRVSTYVNSAYRAIILARDGLEDRLRENEDDDAALVQDMLAHGDIGGVGPAGYGFLLRRGALPLEQRSEADYKPEYTHPSPNSPEGYTYDFEPPPIPETIVIEESPRHSSSSTTTIKSENQLVCAKCLRPLLTEGGGETDEKKHRANRVWALRCGHMLDGRCVEEIMKPQETTPPAPDEEGTSSNTKLLDKGKGKASQVDEPEDELRIKGAATRMVGKGGSSDQASDALPPPADDGPSNIRSRLRSHAAPLLEASTPLPPLEAAKKRERGGKGKGKSKGKGRPRKETYYWSCPVCERIHSSVQIGEGPWSQDQQKGAIALYV